MKRKYLFTSESVTEGHPDKVCDILSDAILDAYLALDPSARVACEVTATTGIVTVMGEITSTATVDIPAIVRTAVKKIGYDSDRFGFNADTCSVMVSIDKQSADIDRGVSRSFEAKEHEACRGDCDACGVDDHENDAIGAGDQGMMFGYASNETDTYMPAPIYYAHKLCQRLADVRKSGALDYLGPDGKSMVTVEYEGDTPVRVDAIVVSSQHTPKVDQDTIRNAVIENVIKPVIPAALIDGGTKILVNPTGRFVHGGPCADTGLTGRKIIVDTYGGVGRHGGGAFSGKDPTKMDRTGAYAARYVAKNIVAAGIASRCEVELAYAIGVANPVSIYVDTFGTSKVEEGLIAQMIFDLFDLRPAALMAKFHMNRIHYTGLASYGHMGREDLDMEWEKTDKVDAIRKYAQDHKML